MKLLSRLGVSLFVPAILSSSLVFIPNARIAEAQSNGQAITLRSDVQEANSQTGVVTARGNVRISYPARDLQATSAQAQYFSNERRLILSGRVSVFQEGNTLRGETVTYLIDEGRFLALPAENEQVESTFIIREN